MEHFSQDSYVPVEIQIENLRSTNIVLNMAVIYISIQLHIKELFPRC
jgi:hypothetical protein